jgi:hypothetical protein
MNPTLKTMLYGAGIATILLYVFDEELQPIINKTKELASKIHPALAFNADGINDEGNVLIGGNRVYQIPINNGATSLPVITPLASPVSGEGQYIGQIAYPMGGAENNLSALINGASWMNAASYTNASFGQNYSGRAVGNE